MHIGAIEIVLIIVSAIMAAYMARRSHCPWLLGIPVQVAVISICTPADPASTLMIALPCCIIYALGVLKSGMKTGTVA